ncbi:MAG TPA: UDP-N-acetylglucosamine 2-epimerase, partial [Methanomassiliicoccaceae archaeon]|nr:UDP-N-acetylglucosamine 2-epimerase [Methanomassiliicoccaceae archaeon]
QLESNARLVLTDSGGVQEETCILNVPCVTLRDNTERPETVEVGSNMLAGTDPNKILTAAREMFIRSRDWSNPFGDGHASRRIMDILFDDIRQ